MKPPVDRVQQTAIGRLIKRKRKEAGFGQLALGTAIGVSLQTIQHYERGSGGVRSYRLAAIAEALGLDCDAFFTEVAALCVEQAPA